jgi:hypothetical protein
MSIVLGAVVGGLAGESRYAMNVNSARKKDVMKAGVPQILAVRSEVDQCLVTYRVSSSENKELEKKLPRRKE